MSKTNARGQMAHSPNEPLPYLPVELQLKIFEFAAYIPRLLHVKRVCQRDEVTEGGGGSQNKDPCTSQDHRHFYQIAAKSRSPPPMLHVSRFFRAEGTKRFYKQRFTAQDEQSPYKYVWVKDDVGILLFGDTVDIPTMRQVFHNEGLFTEVAYMIKDKDSLGERASNVIAALPNGVKTFFMVLHADVWDLAADDIGVDVAFRAAKLDGRTVAAREKKQSFVNAITSAQASSTNLPAFQFVNFAPLRTALRPRIFDTVPMNRVTYDILVKEISDPVLQANFLKLTDCSLFTQQIAENGTRAEIGLFAADKDAMEKGVKEVRAKMAEALRTETKRLTALRPSVNNLNIAMNVNGPPFAPWVFRTRR